MGNQDIRTGKEIAKKTKGKKNTRGYVRKKRQKKTADKSAYQKKLSK